MFTAIINFVNRIVNGQCTGVTIGKQADFDISISLDECTDDLAAGPKM